MKRENELEKIKKKLICLRLRVFRLMFLIGFKTLLYLSVIVLFILAIKINALFYAAVAVDLILISAFTNYSKFDFSKMLDRIAIYNEDIQFYKKKEKYYNDVIDTYAWTKSVH